MGGNLKRSRCSSAAARLFQARNGQNRMAMDQEHEGVIRGSFRFFWYGSVIYLLTILNLSEQHCPIHLKHKRHDKSRTRQTRQSRLKAAKAKPSPKANAKVVLRKLSVQLLS